MNTCKKADCDGRTPDHSDRCHFHFFTLWSARLRETPDVGELEAANEARALTVGRMMQDGWDEQAAWEETFEWVQGQFPNWDLQDKEVPA